ncbi:MAG TPA: sterol desaturase family protein [Pirellulales bacterium]|jgi:sterol desaturase/sphingolipid hydroxylase (fatty acid hydroxylase superfamily)
MVARSRGLTHWAKPLLRIAMSTLVDKLLGSDIPYITYAVPFFFLLIGVEFFVGLVQRKQIYRLNDSINDLSCGVIDQVVGIFLQSLLFAGYLYLFSHARLFDIESAPPAAKWIAAGALMLGVDFCFYWFHRIAHEYAAPWATHVVHHQSEEYNLAVALRQSAFESCFAWIFYLPLAVLGFPPKWYLAMSALNLLYQFWIHTEAIDRLGPLEWVFNTPSHHRVHHARNLKYLDKNYAGMFIIWDRLFGTYQKEEERPVYGITKPLRSWNPLWANLHYWAELAEDAWRAPRWRDKFKIWFMPLGWTPPGLEERPRAKEITREELVKYDPRLPLGMSLYVLAQFVLVLALGVMVLTMGDSNVALREIAGPAALVLGSLANLGGLLENKGWARRAEYARLALLPIAAYWWFGAEAIPIAIATGLATVSALWLFAYRGRAEELETPRIAGETAGNGPGVNRVDASEPNSGEPPHQADRLIRQTN